MLYCMDNNAASASYSNAKGRVKMSKREREREKGGGIYHQECRGEITQRIA